MTETIPFLDLLPLHLELEEELIAVVRTALRTGRFVGGTEVESFEREFAAFCQCADCVAVASGTDALLLALVAAGVQRGDIVITAPNTFIATTEAISHAGAQPVFVDIDEQTCTLSPERLREYLETHPNAPVKAVIPVHLYGQTADMDAILALAEEHGLLVIEDACQAHGAEYFSRKQNRWMKAGSMGCAAAFSFYPGKNLGACGEGGAVTTGNPEIARKIRMLRDHGQARKYYHDLEGYNGRLDAIQAGILRVKLRHLATQNEKRRQAAARYRELLAGIDEVILPAEPDWARAIYHLYVIRTPRRDALQQHMSGNGIGTGLHYPMPLHLQKAYAGRGYAPGDFPVAELVCSEILSLPMFAHLTETQQRRVAGSVSAFAHRTASITAAS